MLSKRLGCSYITSFLLYGGNTKDNGGGGRGRRRVDQSNVRGQRVKETEERMRRYVRGGERKDGYKEQEMRERDGRRKDRKEGRKNVREEERQRKNRHCETEIKA